MPDPFRRLLSRLDGGAVVLTADDRWDLADDWDALAAAGLLAETTPATAVACASCDRPHSEVVFSVETEGRPPRWFHRCPEFGSVRVEPEELRQWAVRIPALGRPLTGRDAEEHVPGLVWRLGPIPVGTIARVGWLVAGWRGRTGIADAVPELLAANAVVFVPRHLPTAAVWGSVPLVVVPLIDVLRVTGTGVEVNRPALAGCLPPEPMVVVETDDRPRLTLPSGTRWEDVTLVVDDHHLDLVLDRDRHRVGYADLGLADGRTGAPVGAWLAFRLLARTGELTPGDGIDTKPGTLKNHMTKLREALTRWTGLAGDPLQPVRKRKPYRPRFQLRTLDTL